MTTFLHSGDIGDILFSLYVCKAFCAQQMQEEKFNYILTIADSFNESKHSQNSFKMLQELLQSQDYVNECSIMTKNEALSRFGNVNLIDLDLFRKMPLNWYSGFIAEYPTHIFNVHLDLEYWEPALTFNDIDYSFKDKILLTYNERYRNPLIDYAVLKDYADSIVFIGIPSEHKQFSQRWFDVEYYESNSFIDLAKKMLGCKVLIGSQGGLYSLAEVVKCRRILCRCDYFIENGQIRPGPANNIPMGGYCDLAITTEKLHSLVSHLI